MGMALDAGQTLGIRGLPVGHRDDEEVPGVEYDPDAVTTLYQDGVDKELFYEIDADVHFIDPHILHSGTAGTSETVEEFGQRRPVLWQLYPPPQRRLARLPLLHAVRGLREVAQVFQREDRFEAFEQVHEEFQSNLAARRPKRSRGGTALPRVPTPEDVLPLPALSTVGRKETLA